MTRAVLMASASSLVVNRAVLPSAFGRDPIGDFWRGVMFGWDDKRGREFDGLQPRMYGFDDYGRRAFIQWSDSSALEKW